MAESLPRPLGPYQLVDLIGRGGMAEVYRARRDGPGGFVKDLALKLILPQYANDEGLISRFMEEARVAGALVHGNVVQVYDFGREEGEYYIVMEYIDGLSLAVVLDRCVESGIPLPSPLVAHIGAEVCSGLSYAHTFTDAEGRLVEVIHRDVSPQNVMLSYTGDVRVGDFGIAKAADSLIQTQAGLRVGKMSYMSPEQARGDPLDGRSDLFALGVTLWEALTLKPLLPRGDAAQTLEILAACDFPSPSSVQPEVPPELEEVVMHALARDRNDRYPDGEAMARRLRAYVHHSAPGFGRHDLVEYLDWLRPDGSRPSTLGPPVPVVIPPSHPPPVPSGRGGGAPVWIWALLAIVPVVGALVGGSVYFLLSYLLAAAPEAPPPPAAQPTPALAVPAPAPPSPPGTGVTSPALGAAAGVAVPAPEPAPPSTGPAEGSPIIDDPAPDPGATVPRRRPRPRREPKPEDEDIFGSRPRND